MHDNEVKELSRRVLSDVGGAFAIAMAYIGDRMGLFRSLAAAGSMSSAALAEKTGLNERYVREWLKAMCSAEYLEFDPDTETYAMTSVQAAVLADEEGPFFMGGALQFTIPSLYHVPRLIDAFHNGGGIPYGELGEEIAEAMDRLHRPLLDHLLVPHWLPNVPGVVEKLDAGIDLLDVGCGSGRSSVALASSFPRSNVVGLDPDLYSIRRARQHAAQAGLTNLHFIADSLDGLPGKPHYQLIVAFDCVHDMAEPVRELATIRALLGTDGRFLWIEPTGSANPLDNRDPVGKMRACVSPLHCLTVSLAYDGAGLGGIIGDRVPRDLAERAGFSQFESVPVEGANYQFFLLRP
ncbi:MAG: class I SAM-dependent methyltransferase [Proteobacteria bacterium]|nr:class I SAM-dependent methyltransferase [Pseudomonadota bacterium]